jgi:hypothetical protein
VPSPLHRGVAIRRDDRPAHGLFAHLHVNRQAKPEMRRLSIARKQRINVV